MSNTEQRDASVNAEAASERQVFDLLADAHAQYERYLGFLATAQVFTPPEELVMPPQPDLTLSVTIGPDEGRATDASVESAS